MDLEQYYDGIYRYCFLPDLMAGRTSDLSRSLPAASDSRIPGLFPMAGGRKIT